MPRLPEVKYPKRLENKLYGLIWDLFKPWYQALVAKAIAEKTRIDHTDSDELHTDGLFDTVFDAARTDWEAKAKAKAADFDNLGLSVDLHARMGLQGQVDAAAAFDPDKTKTVPGITPPKLAELDDFVSENVRLVRKIGDDAADRLQRLVIEAHKNGTSTSDLAKSIKDELEYADNRAHLIAADQLGKINSDLTRLNHEAIGVVGYFWSTSGAPNVRPAHQVRNGVYFAYSDPPADGHAGKPIRCRCTQHPDIFGEGPSQAKPAAEPPPKPKPKASASKKQPTQGSTTPPAAAPPSGGSAPPAGGNGGGKKPPKPATAVPTPGRDPLKGVSAQQPIVPDKSKRYSELNEHQKKVVDFHSEQMALPIADRKEKGYLTKPGHKPIEGFSRKVPKTPRFPGDLDFDLELRFDNVDPADLMGRDGVHNHPIHPITLNSSDIDFAARMNLKSLEAITSYKKRWYTYSIEPGPSGWPSASVSELSLKIKEKANELINIHQDKLLELGFYGGLVKKWATHQSLIDLCLDYELKYTVTEILEVPHELSD